jgi:hypothetical protein
MHDRLRLAMLFIIHSMQCIVYRSEDTVIDSAGNVSKKMIAGGIERDLAVIGQEDQPCLP